MTMRHLGAGLASGALALAVAACGDPKPPAAPTLAPATVTESFAANLGPQARNSHTFSVGASGSVRVTLTRVVPGAVLGIGVGLPGTGTCNASRSTAVVPGATVQLDGVATIPGTFCLAVFDVGNLVEAVDYTVTVQHP